MPGHAYKLRLPRWLNTNSAGTFDSAKQWMRPNLRDPVFVVDLAYTNFWPALTGHVCVRVVFFYLVAPITSWGYRWLSQSPGLSHSRQTGRRYSRTLDCAAVCCEAENSSWRRFTRRCNLSAV